MFPICLLPAAGLRNRRENDTASAPELFYHEHGSNSGTHGFHVCGSCSGAVAILQLKKCGSHYRTKKKVVDQILMSHLHGDFPL